MHQRTQKSDSVFGRTHGCEGQCSFKESVFHQCEHGEKRRYFYN